ncbi:pyruvate kinase [Mannheimia pernigra]|uniref:pyruvate kinase n=1 Tax=Mannheimia pernigra TaxID=111844 RepID=UPI00159F3F18|nr:pyruvate kinase [Mannheimia pernigra]QLB44367.1 pyruvate kinase [Mannheimia pernigra]QLB44434.1 pyruvate kinase [Mannheimia pernigra]
MKPFDLEKALSGEPVVTRKGEKAYILANLNNVEDRGFDSDYPLVGIIQNRIHVCCWTLEGRIALQNNEALGDIVGMWEEPSPRVQLDLPCPLKKWRSNCYTITGDLSVKKTVYTERPFDEDLNFYFVTEKDAQEWLNAMRNSRR